MSYKRSRTDFEADSTFAIYGTPLPPYDPEARDDGTYVPVWKQEAVDERGRKRFHGAFTGGFSAGYYNTVGSKEGWTPATFVSSRSKRAKDQKDTVERSAQDFMDEEDLADQEQARQLQTNESFAGLGSTADDARRRDALVDLMRPTTSIGVQLLQKMGWRQGQGIGQKVLRKTDTQADNKVLQFAPENTKMISFLKKTDRKGLGFQGEASLAARMSENSITANDEDDIAMSRARLLKDTKSKKKTGFGVGILNDNGSDDEDPYDSGPKISYNRALGPVKKVKKPIKPGSNPLLSTKPVFVKRKKLQSSTSLIKCHDGRLPLDGFILSASPYNPSFASDHPPLKVPDDWISSRKPLSSTASDANSAPTNTASANTAQSSSLNPSTRATLLGEKALPGKSVFDYLTPSARDHLASVTGNANLPLARSEPVPLQYRKSEKDRTTLQWQFVPPLDASLAKAALDRADAAGGGFMPYADNEGKRKRYRSFLELHAGIHALLPARAEGATNDEWASEMREFAQAAQVFRPMSGLMASRFTSSSSSSSSSGPTAAVPPIPKIVDPAEQAAQMKMFGPLTRSVQNWTPAKLLCKRFGVRPPVIVEVDEEPPKAPSASYGHGAMGTADQKMMLALPAPSISHGTRTGSMLEQSAPITVNPVVEPAKVNMERNEALEADRPSDALFRAVFGSDSEDDV